MCDDEPTFNSQGETRYFSGGLIPACEGPIFPLSDDGEVLWVIPSFGSSLSVGAVAGPVETHVHVNISAVDPDSLRELLCANSYRASEYVSSVRLFDRRLSNEEVKTLIADEPASPSPNYRGLPVHLWTKPDE